MSGLRTFIETMFGVSPTNPEPPTAPAKPRHADPELLDLILAHIREGRRTEALTDPAFFDRKARLFERMATAECERSWDLANDPEQSRYHMRLSVRATEVARISRRRARELRETHSMAVWGGHP